jgi:hypothetical protein
MIDGELTAPAIQGKNVNIDVGPETSDAIARCARCARFAEGCDVVLLAAISLPAAFSAPAVAQFEIDPDHFDQMGTARANGHAAKSRAGRKAISTTHQQKNSRQTSKHPGNAGESRQAKAGNQPLAGQHSKNE